MTARVVKKAVSIPEPTYKRAEALRRRLGKSRSALYAQALESYFHALELRESEARYAAGYAKFPEAQNDAEAAMKASLPAMDPEDW